MTQPGFDLPVFDPLRLSATSLDVQVVRHLGAQGIRARQVSRLRALVRSARRGTALYRELLPADCGDAGAAVDLQRLPAVDRALLMGRFDDWVADPEIRRPDLQAFMADPRRIGSAYLGRYIVWESSGTSGAPGLFVQDARAMAVYDALEALRRHTLRPVRAQGFHRRDRRIGHSGHCALPPGMGRADHAGLPVSQQHRGAIRSDNAQQYAGLVSDQRIGMGPPGIVPVARHHTVAPVDLIDRNEPCPRQHGGHAAAAVLQHRGQLRIGRVDSPRAHIEPRDHPG